MQTIRPFTLSITPGTQVVQVPGGTSATPGAVVPGGNSVSVTLMLGIETTDAPAPRSFRVFTSEQDTAGLTYRGSARLSTTAVASVYEV